MTKTRGRPPKGQKRLTDAQIKLKELVNFYIESDIHKHAEFMVDSLWGHTNLLKVIIIIMNIDDSLLFCLLFYYLGLEEHC